MEKTPKLLDGKGYGMIAKCDISYGSIILTEKPLMIIHSNQLSNIKDEYEKISPEKKHFIEQLYGYDEDLLNVINMNCYVLEADTRSALFYYLSFINHSCEQNAFYRWNFEQEEMTLIADRDLKCNEEILISYIETFKTREIKFSVWFLLSLSVMSSTIF
ncbi:unnamed protein product [Didymodactylos carnosus]|uniref:SET domain-containing protein n=1 Tax=Didymodactylos carnosus TaxID=1234261 RepID=A0A8S2FJI8_9BILA|nr:unnamed protein product [Didymodactylos carnosus]CAF4276180.1 unnamed protein product [Didymodactylos carnosus]